MEDKDNQQKPRSKRFLVFYIIGLFSVALVLILLSYLTQVRSAEQMETISGKLTEQQNVAAGAQQQMSTLQDQVEEQKKEINTQNEELAGMREQLGIGAEDDLTGEVTLLQERYIALDALQQLRRKVDANQMAQAKVLVDQMIRTYGEARLTNGTQANSVLVGVNSTEFTQLRQKVTSALATQGAATATP